MKENDQENEEVFDSVSEIFDKIKAFLYKKYLENNMIFNPENFTLVYSFCQTINYFSVLSLESYDESKHDKDYLAKIRELEEKMKNEKDFNLSTNRTYSLRYDLMPSMNEGQNFMSMELFSLDDSETVKFTPQNEEGYTLLYFIEDYTKTEVLDEIITNYSKIKYFPIFLSTKDQFVKYLETNPTLKELSKSNKLYYLNYAEDDEFSWELERLRMYNMISDNSPSFNIFILKDGKLIFSGARYSKDYIPEILNVLEIGKDNRDTIMKSKVEKHAPFYYYINRFGITKIGKKPFLKELGEGEIQVFKWEGDKIVLKYHL